MMQVLPNFKFRTGDFGSDFSRSEWVSLTKSIDSDVKAHSSPFVVGPSWDDFLKCDRGEPIHNFLTFPGNTCKGKGDGVPE